MVDDRDVDVAARRERRSHRLVAALEGREVGQDLYRPGTERLDLPGDRRELVAEPIHEVQDARSFAREGQRGGPAEAAARTSYKNVFLNVPHWVSMGAAGRVVNPWRCP